MDFDTFTDITRYIEDILRIIGFALMFRKFGKKWWYALIPVYSSYKFAETVDKEEDGIVWCISDLVANWFEIVFTVFDFFDKTNSLAGYITTMLMTIFGVIYYIYSYRIFVAVTREFGCKKIWALGWTFFTGIVAVIWGVSSKFKPKEEVFEGIDVSGKESNLQAETLNEGLTVNINKREAVSRFKKKIMLKDIHLNIEPGKMVLLLGGSGAGKTTFFNAITGYEKADATVTLNGVDIYNDFDKMKYEVGFVPQQELLRTTDTVIKTLEDSAKLRLPENISKQEREERIKEVMHMFGLTKIKDNVISKQSGGQKKRISIAMEYISNPSLFILDEPDSGLDGILAKELMSDLHKISREGKIVIVVTHTPDRVIDLFDEVIVLAKDSNRTGRLVFKGPVDEARKFFGVDTMEGIVKKINQPDEGGDGKADELIAKFWEVSHESAK